MKRKTLFLSLLLTLGASSYALAAETAPAPAPQRPAAGPGPHGPMSGPFAASNTLPGPLGALNLSDKQREKILKLVNEERALHQQQWQAMNEAMQKTRELYMQDKWDAKAILKAQDDVYHMRRATMVKSIEAHNQIYDILTPAQRKQLDAMRQRPAQRPPGAPAAPQR